MVQEEVAIPALHQDSPGMLETGKKSPSNHSVASLSASDANSSRHPLLRKAQRWGVLESRGIAPAPLHERTDQKFFSVFSVWFSMSLSVLPVVTGMVGPMSGLSLRDSALTILFFCLLTAAPPGLTATLGPKTGMRQMIQSRYAFGLFGNMLPVALNAASVTGYCILNSIVGGQTLAAVSDNRISWNVGIVIVGLVACLATTMGYRVLHLFDRFAWIPTLVAIVVAVGCGGDKLSLQASTQPATAAQILTFGSLIAGYMIPWAGMGSDFCTYMRPDVPSWRIFAYVYGGLVLPSVPLMTLGAAIASTMEQVPSWAEANVTNSAGGVLAEMLQPAGGFGKFCVVLLAFSVMANIVGSLYAVSLNCQMFLPPLIHVPRPVFVIIVTAVFIPVATQAANNFYDSLSNFISVISYWAAAWVAIWGSEFIVFRRRNTDNMDPAQFQSARQLPTGIAAVTAGCLSAALFIPSMDQSWFVGPIAKKTGDIGFEMAFAVSLLSYIPLRALEVRLRGGKI